MVKIQNLFNHSHVRGEHFDTLVESDSFRLERIVSMAHATPEGEWYDQAWSEWVVLLKGSAGLLIEGQNEIVLRPGDSVNIPAHARHRVQWTEAETIWVALNHGPTELK